MVRCLAIVSMALALTIGTALADEFCDGFERGYATDYVAGGGGTDGLS
jgi:hypothetical protein